MQYSNNILEKYESRPRKWWLYTLIVFIMALLLSWSASSVTFKGFAAKGTEVAKGIFWGLVKPDMNLLFSTSTDGVPYLLMETVCIAILGTVVGGILALPISFLASPKIMPKPVAFIFNALILLIRTLPSIVWALIWIRVTGPGAFCGVITQSICSIGMISKMYITAIADLDTSIIESLDAPAAIEMTGGEQILDFIHVDDISRFLIYVIQNHCSFCMLEKNGEDFHLGTGRGTTVREVAKIIESVSKRRCNINWGARAYRDRDTMYAVAPIAKNIELIQWKAQIELKVGIERYLNKQ